MSANASRFASAVIIAWSLVLAAYISSDTEVKAAIEWIKFNKEQIAKQEAFNAQALQRLFRAEDKEE